MPDGHDLASRIEPDAHLLWMRLATHDGDLIVYSDTQEYADAVTTILEGLYPGAADRITFVILGTPPTDIVD